MRGRAPVAENNFYTLTYGLLAAFYLNYLPALRLLVI